MKNAIFMLLCLLMAGCVSYPAVDEPFVSGEVLTMQFRSAVSNVSLVEVEAVCPSESPQSNVVSRITSPDRIATLWQHIEAQDKRGLSICMCTGEVTLRFFEGTKLVLSCTVHHGQSLRIRRSVRELDWSGNVNLTPESSAFIKGWLNGLNYANYAQQSPAGDVLKAAPDL